MCGSGHKAGATIQPVILSEEREGPMDDASIVRIQCKESYWDQISFKSEYAKELGAKTWPWGTQYLLALASVVLPLAILSAVFSFSGKVLLVGIALWYANYLFAIVAGRLGRFLQARYLRELLGPEGWTCEVGKDIVTAKFTGHHSVFLNRYLTRIEDCGEAVILHYGDFGRLRIPLPRAATELERRLLVRRIGKRLKPAPPQKRRSPTGEAGSAG